eukprot:scaffold48695_cov53-Attheya_sp.AAC.2
MCYYLSASPRGHGNTQKISSCSQVTSNLRIILFNLAPCGRQRTHITYMPPQGRCPLQTKQGIRLIVPKERAIALGFPKGWAERKGVHEAVPLSA